MVRHNDIADDFVAFAFEVIEPVIKKIVGSGELDERQPVSISEGDEVEPVFFYMWFADCHGLDFLCA